MLHFMYTAKALKCPFCHTYYSEVLVAKVAEKPKDLPAQTGKKVAVKTQKESFKMWKNS